MSGVVGNQSRSEQTGAGTKNPHWTDSSPLTAGIICTRTWQQYPWHFVESNKLYIYRDTVYGDCVIWVASSCITRFVYLRHILDIGSHQDTLTYMAKWTPWDNISLGELWFSFSRHIQDKEKVGKKISHWGAWKPLFPTRLYLSHNCISTVVYSAHEAS
jgi:hypothetical protein